jgi:translation elongation factor P/translation initiation factor 5A
MRKRKIRKNKKLHGILKSNHSVQKVEVHDYDWAYRNATKPINTIQDMKDCYEALEILSKSGKPTHLYFP